MQSRFQRQAPEMRLFAILAIAAIGMVALSSCGSSQKSAAEKPAKTVASREPETVAACIAAWNQQGVKQKAEAAIFGEGEGDLEAWVALYEGPPVELEVGSFAGTFEGRHCLVAIPAEESVWAFKGGEWFEEEFSRGTLYEYATESQAANQAEFVTNSNLALNS